MRGADLSIAPGRAGALPLSVDFRRGRQTQLPLPANLPT